MADVAILKNRLISTTSVNVSQSYIHFDVAVTVWMPILKASLHATAEPETSVLSAMMTLSIKQWIVSVDRHCLCTRKIYSIRHTLQILLCQVMWHPACAGCILAILHKPKTVPHEHKLWRALYTRAVIICNTDTLLVLLLNLCQQESDYRVRQ